MKSFSLQLIASQSCILHLKMSGGRRVHLNIINIINAGKCGWEMGIHTCSEGRGTSGRSLWSVALHSTSKDSTTAWCSCRKKQHKKGRYYSMTEIVSRMTSHNQITFPSLCCDIWNGHLPILYLQHFIPTPQGFNWAGAQSLTPWHISTLKCNQGTLNFITSPLNNVYTFTLLGLYNDIDKHFFTPPIGSNNSRLIAATCT